MRYILAESESDKRLAEKTVSGYFERRVCFRIVRICTAKKLRDLAQELWDKKKDTGEDQIVSVCTISDNTVYVGCKVDGWRVEGGVESLTTNQIGIGPRVFRVDDIKELYVSS